MQCVNRSFTLTLHSSQCAQELLIIRNPGSSQIADVNCCRWLTPAACGKSSTKMTFLRLAGLAGIWPDCEFCWLPDLCWLAPFKSPISFWVIPDWTDLDSCWENMWSWSLAVSVALDIGTSPKGASLAWATKLSKASNFDMYCWSLSPYKYQSSKATTAREWGGEDFLPDSCVWQGIFHSIEYLDLGKLILCH